MHIRHDRCEVLECDGREQHRIRAFTTCMTDPLASMGENLFDRISVGVNDRIECMVFARMGGFLSQEAANIFDERTRR